MYAQAELKVLMDLTSPSFSFAKDLLRHNLVSFCGRSILCGLYTGLSVGNIPRW